MKKNVLFCIASLLVLTSCATKSENYIHIFCNADYFLTDAAYNDSYILSSMPAYFNQISGSINCIDQFDKSKCYCTYRTEVIDNKPIGKGEIYLSFSNQDLDAYHCFFDYYINFDSGYGGQLFIVDQGIIEIGSQYVRGKYWWTRVEFTLPQLEYRRTILQFGNPIAYDDLDEFDGNTYFG